MTGNLTGHGAKLILSTINHLILRLILKNTIEILYVRHSYSRCYLTSHVDWLGMSVKYILCRPSWETRGSDTRHGSASVNLSRLYVTSPWARALLQHTSSPQHEHVQHLRLRFGNFVTLYDMIGSFTGCFYALQWQRPLVDVFKEPGLMGAKFSSFDWRGQRTWLKFLAKILWGHLKEDTLVAKAFIDKI